MLADPDVGEPQRLGLEGEAADQGWGGALAGVGEVDAEVHGGGLLLRAERGSLGNLINAGRLASSTRG